MTPSTALRSFAQPFTRLLASSRTARQHRLNRLMQPARQGLLTAAVMLSLAGTAKAAGSSMPWEGPLDTIMQSLSGPVAKAVGIIAIVLTGLGFAFAEGGSALRKGIGIVFGLAIAFTATTFISTFFNMGSCGP